MLGERPLLVGQEILVMDLYRQMRSATPSDRGVDPLAFVTLYERLNGESDVELLLDELRALDDIHLGAVRDRMDREIASQEKRKRERQRVGRA